MSVHCKIADEDRNRASIAEWLEARHPEVAAQAMAARCDGRLLDLNLPLPSAAELDIVTFDDEEGREVYRHTASHVMAQAVKRLVPEAKLAIGPAIADGFYYDFDSPEAFSPEFLERVEAEMRKIVAADYPTERLEMSREEAIRFFRERGESYKVELLEDIADDSVSCYRQDDFVDLCRGPHLPSTGRVTAFKLLSVAGAYWRGDEHRPMLQRIYATAFPSQEMLDEYLRRREEAAKRDHRRLGRELDLFSIQEAVGPGLALWHPKGALIRELIEDFWRREHRRRGYDIVVTPHIGKESLWEQSGHLEHFADGMYAPMVIEEERYRIKPMNCPFHLLIYKSQVHSYRNLPVRMAEMGTVYRYERSGVLEGLLRVRSFTQDDAHIFCTPEQMPEEILGVLDFALYMMRTFGYEDLEVELAVRDERPGGNYLGEDADWESAQAMLAEALRARGVEYKIGVGEAKFYGPAIDIKLKDCMGKSWQGPTIQFDFNEPKRFEVTYVGEDGQHHYCVMIHRVVLGAMERFIAGLVEHYGGAFPLWLSPVQAVMIPITDRQHAYAREVHQALAERGIRAQVDDRNESMRLKIREAQLQKVPYMLVVGDREVEARSVSVRERSQGDLGSMGLDEFVASIEQEAKPPDLRR
jgi:threonyl-tRNA synthetase